MKYIQTKRYKKKRKLIRKSLKSQIIFEKKVAIRFSDPKYYLAMGQDILNLDKKEGEKLKMSRPKCARLTALFKKFKSQLNYFKKGTFYTLNAIYNRNRDCAIENLEPPKHRKIMSLVSSVPMLLLAYSKVKRNKGALSIGAPLAHRRIKWLNPFQRRFLSNTCNGSEGLTYDHFVTTSKLLKKGIYPWGASKRIYISKPGQPGKKRPITIPPFIDRLVQASILRILEAIYEPWFEKLNRSFGFRPNKGCHDAIYNLIRIENRGLFMAIEGDIKGAYDNVKKTKLLSILEKRIQDRKFLNMLKDRLDYIYLDTEQNKYVEEQIGIPQGGIDSPYLWNIYMHEFDLHINSYIEEMFTKLNNKLSHSKGNKVKENLKRF